VVVGGEERIDILLDFEGLTTTLIALKILDKGPLVVLNGSMPWGEGGWENPNEGTPSASQDVQGRRKSSCLGYRERRPGPGRNSKAVDEKLVLSYPNSTGALVSGK
jgi:hypothetical protein